MVVTVFGATGMVGKHIVQQALLMGHTVKAFGRNVEGLIDKDLRNAKFQAIKGYIFDADDVLSAIKGSNAVLSALGGSIDGFDKTRSLGIKNIIAQMNKAGVQRIIALGGLGVLNADDENLIINNPDYPEEYMAVGLEHLEAFKMLQASSLKWTFVCPPKIINQNATENYRTRADYPPDPNAGYITGGDLAHFMLSQVSLPDYENKKAGISN